MGRGKRHRAENAIPFQREPIFPRIMFDGVTRDGSVKKGRALRLQREKLIDERQFGRAVH